VYSPRIVVPRLLGVRMGEWRLAILSFLVLLWVSAAYTVLETARDALLVTELPRRAFGIAYLSVAVCALPAAGILARVGRRWAPQRVLLATIAVAALAPLPFVWASLHRTEVVGLYVVVGLISSSVFPQFWVVMGFALTVSQGRRLVGPVASGSVLGAVGGSLLATAVVSALPIRSLLLVSSAMFVVAAAAAAFLTIPPEAPTTTAPAEAGFEAARGALQEEPYLRRVALLVAVTTATALAIDYFFKWTIARVVPEIERGSFIARYYAMVNSIALVVQIFLGGAIVRRLGVMSAMLVTPLLSVLGGVAALISGAFALPVLVLKAADGSLRSSINRLTTELVYLPVSSAGREKAKPLIDGALFRVAQAAMAGTLLGLANTHVLSARVLSAIIIVLGVAWLVTAVTMRFPYLGQLRRSVSLGFGERLTLSRALDLESAELLVESLGSDDPAVAIAAMNALARRGRDRFIPALVLRHTDERLLQRALEIFARSSRTDWHQLATRLLGHASEGVRIAAARALAIHGKLDSAQLAVDSAPSVRAYATLHAALAAGTDDLLRDPHVAELVRGDDASRLGALAAIADAAPTSRTLSLLLVLADSDDTSQSALWTELLARAAVKHQNLDMIPRLVARLAHRAGRESVRQALVALGRPALEAVVEALHDPHTERGVRIHLPQTLGCFETKSAADQLLDCVESGKDGLIRYKALRALGKLVSPARIRVDRVRVERCILKNLTEHLKLLGLRVALGSAPAQGKRYCLNTHRLLTGLLDDKVRQSKERAFRLLKIAHPREDIHRVYRATYSSDKRARANAGEFLDALLRRRDQQQLRELVRVISDDLPVEEQVRRGAQLAKFEPLQSRDAALAAAIEDADVKLAALAALHAVALGDAKLEASVHRAQEQRPALAATAHLVFQEPLATG
jgi:AAA family ATP:ADP antiporter